MSKIINTKRPYLVIPKLIEQPTWGGSYIVENKGWSKLEGYDVKIGQSYELFSGSNLSLCLSSNDPMFQGELTDRDAVQEKTNPNNSISLSELVAIDPESALGKDVIDERGEEIRLLIKFTQALGNSFQVHIRDGVNHPKFKPKPESWYYFEPGLITLGVKSDAMWDLYESSVRNTQNALADLSKNIKSGAVRKNDISTKVSNILEQFDPWQYVNTVEVKKDQVVDLSAGGVHHSWEEDLIKAPLGNVLLELQGEAMDDISTFRCFDKGKIGDDGTLRDVHIDTYFDVIDRTASSNDPVNHMQVSKILSENTEYRLELLMRSRHYNLDKITLLHSRSTYREDIQRYKHFFVKSGQVRITAGGVEITVGTGHSCLVPAEAGNFLIENISERSEILVSY
jgi:mannose-6-phosphate isomerase class I